VTVAAIRAMVEKGLTLEQALIAMEIVETQEATRLEAMRVKARMRQRKHRSVTQTPVTQNVTLETPSFAEETHPVTMSRVTCDMGSQEKERSPTPPKENSSLPLLYREADASLVNGQPLTCEIHREKREQERERLREFGQGWNDLAAELNLPQIEEIEPGSQRERHAIARLRKMPSTDCLWPFIRGSPYLRGEVNGFRCTFDWVVNAANFQKIRDGNYAPRQDRPKQINFLAERRR
jgi:hypothetical protein